MVVRGGVWPMGCLAGGLRPNPWTVCVVVQTFEAGVVVGPRGAGLMILSQPMDCLFCFVHVLIKPAQIIGG